MQMQMRPDAAHSVAHVFARFYSRKGTLRE